MQTFRGLVAGIALAVGLAGCGAGTPAATVAPPADAVEFARTLCTATDELLLAVGNPDAGSDSPAWAAFTDAIERGDLASLERAGATILGHLARARAANDRGATFPPATAANAELDAILTAVETQVRTVLDAKGDPAAATAAEEAARPAWERHWVGWLLAMRALAEGGVVMPNIPCDEAAPRST